RLIYLAGIQTEGHFENFCEVIGRKDLIDDPRFATSAGRLANRRECIAVLDEVFATRDLAQWVEALREMTTPWTVVQTAAEAGAAPRVAANAFPVAVAGPAGPYPLVASPAQFDGTAPALTPAPEHGQHTEEVLLELGRSWAQITDLKDRDVVV